MMSKETLEQIRRMSNAERFAMAAQMTREAIPYLLRGTPELVARRFELLRRQNEEFNRLVLTALSQDKERHEGSASTVG